MIPNLKHTEKSYQFFKRREKEAIRIIKIYNLISTMTVLLLFFIGILYPNNLESVAYGAAILAISLTVGLLTIHLYYKKHERETLNICYQIIKEENIKNV